jgi:integrase
MDATPITVAGLLQKYLEWCGKHRARRTLEWYQDHLRAFLGYLGEAAGMIASQLKPYHVVEWADAHEGWSPTYKRGAIVSVQRPFNWAEEMGYIAASPIKKIRKPGPQHRDNPVTPDVFRTLLEHVRAGDPFRDLLLFCWHTGCRPQEAWHAEARHAHLDAVCLVIPKEEAKGRRGARVILLAGVALEIATRLVSARPTGKLFLNTRGRPWNTFAACSRFARLAVKIGHRYAAYDLRHGFCQRLLEGGANHLAVAELLGHANGQMVASVYSHMNRATAHLRETLLKAAQ